MPFKTITLYPKSWQIRDNPYGDMLWSPSIGAANMLEANDGDYASAISSGGFARDSDALDALTFKDSITGAFPVFEPNARNPSLTVSCVMGTGSALLAEPTIFVYDVRFMGSVEQIQPFASVTAAATYSHASAMPSTVNVFDAMATGNFAMTCIFPARPNIAGHAAGLSWNQAIATLTYTYGGYTTPDPFNFANKYGGPGALVLSDVIAITGITDGPQLVSVSGDASAVFSIAGGAFSATPRNIANGQTLQLRMTAPGAAGASANCAVLVESRSDAWSVTTGNDVPTGIIAPADQVNVMPGSVVEFLWQFSGNDVPMGFSFSGWPGRYSMDNRNTWTDAATPGTLPLGTPLYFQMNAPLGPSMTATPAVTYGSTHLVDAANATTGNENLVYALDLSPIDTFQASHAGQATTWNPIASGAARHVSVANPISMARGNTFAHIVSNIEVGRWWRLADGTQQQWIAGTTIIGIGFGSYRTNTNASYQLGANVGRFAVRDPAGGAYTDLPGIDSADGQAQVILNDVAPGILPAAWSGDAILAALKADTFALGKWADLTDVYGYASGSVQNYTLLLRVFFRVARPPEGMMWEG